MIIAVDGYSSTGKSTIARGLAKHFGYTFIDTGAMYRAVTFYCIQEQLFSNSSVDEDKILDHLDKINISFAWNEKTKRSDIFLNGKNIEGEIRSMSVSELVSKVAQLKEVRKNMISHQREMGRDKSVVLDGRDIGSVVFPNADIKFFIVADTDIRAKRRYDELLSNQSDISFEEVKDNIIKRDREDTQRAESPLVKPEGAVVIDNTNLSIEEQLKKVISIVESRL
ncbi:cytidylate kinase [Ichthyobacterium seriolicida]|uniref:Cytidylate kinase n=1 Tax=Ichthyobacterium seriolicida TaxID=242600 RepID=A0A1J1ECP7_9FLAO|nr:cytidylate kinase [Ichthyobacterium seriolicida]